MTDKAVLGVVADIGGTHARFAVAETAEDGRLTLAAPKVLLTRDYPSLQAAFAAYAAGLPAPPRRAAFAVAGPVGQDAFKLTNSSWHFRRSTLKDDLQLEGAWLVNDFAAIAHAIPHCAPGDFQTLGEAGFSLPELGAVSVVGPGTGLGVGLLVRRHGEDVVVPTEGGHAGFAPPDSDGLAMLQSLLKGMPRVSAERVLCGDGLVLVYKALTAQTDARDSIALWDAVIAGKDDLAAKALDRWLYLLGMFAGDVALTQGAGAVVMAGGILPRLGAARVTTSFIAGFCNKGRFAAAMTALPVAILAAGQPGLMGAAALLKSHSI
jgi:glucokinase